MRELVRREMEAGALGITTGPYLSPAFFAKTEELIEMQGRRQIQRQVHHAHAQRRQSADRSRAGNDTHQSRGRAAAEIYHLKASGAANWPKMDQVFKMIQNARRRG